MNPIWITVLLLSFVWTSAFHIYEPPTPMWIGLVVVGMLLSMTGYILREKDTLASSAVNSLKYSGIILLTQGAVFPFYCIFAARFHSEPIFGSIAGWVLNLFGMHTVSDGNLLYIDSFLRTYVFSSEWEKVGAPYLLMLSVGGVITLLMSRAKAKHYAAFFASAFIWTVLRYAVLIMLFATYTMHSLFWERTITFVTFLPYGFVLGVLFKNLPAPLADLRLGKLTRRSTITAILSFLLVFSGVSYFGFRDLGSEKQGRVLIDEYHSDWEWTTDIYDEQWFGERSGYNYYCFFNFLDKYYKTDRNMTAIDADTLTNVDVYIMKTPTRPFTDDEVAYMTSFVERGGGLYLIGDHTNVFGTGTNLNQIAETFGLRFNYDCTYEIEHGSLSEYDAPVLLPHRGVRDLPHFLFATSNTLSAKWQADEIIIGYGLKGLQADYSQKNFFPADTNSPNLEFGLFLQSAAVQYGRGRVLAFTDSTVFSNFWMFMPGKPELLLNSVEWLNRENNMTGIAPRTIAGISLLVMLTANIAYAVWSRKDYKTGYFLIVGIGALVIGCGTYQIIGASGSPDPQPIKPMVNIAFDRQYSRYQMPDNLEGFMANMDEQLNTFYVWTQRLDYFPKVENKLSDAIDKSDLTVMAKPDEPIKNVNNILEQIKAGGKLLILDNTASGSNSSTLLKAAGMELKSTQMAVTADYDEIANIPLTSNASAITGGEIIIRDASGNSIFSVARIGDGLIAVFSDPDLFYNYELGDVSANLTEKTEILTNLEFKILKYLVGE